MTKRSKSKSLLKKVLMKAMVSDDNFVSVSAKNLAAFCLALIRRKDVPIIRPLKEMTAQLQSLLDATHYKRVNEDTNTIQVYSVADALDSIDSLAVKAIDAFNDFPVDRPPSEVSQQIRVCVLTIQEEIDRLLELGEEGFRTSEESSPASIESTPDSEESQ